MIELLVLYSDFIAIIIKLPNAIKCKYICNMNQGKIALKLLQYSNYSIFV